MLAKDKFVFLLCLNSYTDDPPAAYLAACLKYCRISSPGVKSHVHRARRPDNNPSDLERLYPRPELEQTESEKGG
jgi:hypothetical protein